ncbi:MAG: helix-turn-helix transcriptional regulator [Clostridia bacterium]|nr:helix-turn-helix transcriptional regulator [Clostridia bacterium]
MTTVKEAVAARFVALMKERGIRTNTLANISGVTPSSVYSMLDPRRKEISVNLVKKLCDGLDISLGEFFSDVLFDELEQEIR